MVLQSTIDCTSFSVTQSVLRSPPITTSSVAPTTTQSTTTSTLSTSPWSSTTGTTTTEPTTPTGTSSTTPASSDPTEPSFTPGSSTTDAPTTQPSVEPASTTPTTSYPTEPPPTTDEPFSSTVEEWQHVPRIRRRRSRPPRHQRSASVTSIPPSVARTARSSDGSLTKVHRGLPATLKLWELQVDDHEYEYEYDYEYESEDEEKNAVVSRELSSPPLDDEPAGETCYCDEGYEGEDCSKVQGRSQEEVYS